MASEKSIGNIPEGIYARIPLAELTIAEASEQVDDASFWERTRIPILFHFSQIRLGEYEELTVGDHRDLYDYLLARGLVDG